MERARCRGHDPGMFFPAPGPGMVPAMAAAMAMCSVCPVREPCLEYAVADPEITGIWGGTSAKARARMRRGLQAA